MGVMGYIDDYYSTGGLKENKGYERNYNIILNTAFHANILRLIPSAFGRRFIIVDHIGIVVWLGAP
jgi:hypothetical protein